MCCVTVCFVVNSFAMCPAEMPISSLATVRLSCLWKLFGTYSQHIGRRFLELMKKVKIGGNVSIAKKMQVFVTKKLELNYLERYYLS